MMNRNDALNKVEQTLALVSSDTATVSLSANREGATRYANNIITQNVAADRITLRVSAAFGQKVGIATTNQLDADSLADAVKRAEDAARASDPDLEYLPPLGAQDYPEIHGHSADTAAAGPQDRARIVAALTGAPRNAGYRAAGSVTVSENFDAIGTSTGLRAYHPYTNARVLCTVIADGASGWAGAGSYDLASISIDEIAERAFRKGEDARNPVEVEAGPTTVILEPQAVADLLEYLVWDMDAKAADEGRSVFTGKEGTRVAGPEITVRSQPAHPLVPGSPFLADGAAASDVQWLDAGTVKSLKTSRFWAQKTGRERVGMPGNVIMDGGSASTQDLVARVERGLLVTRFWYIRTVDPMKQLLTGMTRDGVYRIEDGKIAGAALNMRFNESPLRMLANVKALGTPVATREEVVAPALLINDFHFTSVTRF
ncbi:MAG TPA: TldD/PmbA family protein [Armatimonadota bacterium]